MDSVKREYDIWISCAIYLQATQEKMASRFAAVTTEEIIQINFFMVYIIWNNYSPQCRWLALDMYLAALRLGKYPPLATSTSVNSC